MASEILTCDGLSIGYDMPLVSGIGFGVSRGALTLIYGPNGVGKTTLARTLFGLAAPLAGTYRWNLEGAPVTPQALVESGARFLGQGPRGFGSLSVRRQLRTLNTLYGLEPAAVPESSWRGRNVGALSYGQRRLAALRTLQCGAPECYILDEPLAGLDQRVADEVIEWVRSATQAGVGILMIEHRVGRLLSLVDNIVILQGRSVFYSGPAEQMPPEARMRITSGGGIADAVDRST
jgi:branched-chain amino acid transport system ATP-binding protein